VLVLVGELDIASAPTLTDELERYSSSPTVVVDLRELEFIDSTGVGVLVTANVRARESGRELFVVTASNGQVLRVLELTGVRDHLQPPDNLDDLLLDGGS
jgi:anti-sigma B factor antagonist